MTAANIVGLLAALVLAVWLVWAVCNRRGYGYPMPSEMEREVFRRADEEIRRVERDRPIVEERGGDDEPPWGRHQ